MRFALTIDSRLAVFNRVAARDLGIVERKNTLTAAGNIGSSVN